MDTSKVKEIIKRKAKQYGLEEYTDILLAQAKQESGYNPKAKSGAGAMGVMQLMPGTAAQLGVKDPWDAEQNIDGGVRYMKQQMDQYGDIRYALAAFNGGPKAVPWFRDRRKGDFTPNYSKKFEAWDHQTADYVKKITGTTHINQPLKKKFDGLPDFSGLGGGSINDGLPDFSGLNKPVSTPKGSSDEFNALLKEVQNKLSQKKESGLPDFSGLNQQTSQTSVGPFKPKQDQFGEIGQFSPQRLFSKLSESTAKGIGSIAHGASDIVTGRVNPITGETRNENRPLEGTERFLTGTERKQYGNIIPTPPDVKVRVGDKNATVYENKLNETPRQGVQFRQGGLFGGPDARIEAPKSYWQQRGMTPGEILEKTKQTVLGETGAVVNEASNILEGTLNIPGIVSNLGRGVEDTKLTDLPKIPKEIIDESALKGSAGTLLPYVAGGLGLSKGAASLATKVAGDASSKLGTALRIAAVSQGEGALAGSAAAGRGGNTQERVDNYVREYMAASAIAGATEKVLGPFGGTKKSSALESRNTVQNTSIPKIVADVSGGVTDDIDFLSKKDALLAKSKLLGSSALADTRRVPERLTQISRNILKRGASFKGDVRKLYEFTDSRIAALSKEIGIKEDAVIKDLFETGVWDEVAEFGDSTRVPQATVDAIKRDIAEFKDFQDAHFKPIMGNSYNPNKLYSSSQRGDIVVTINPNKLNPAEFDQLKQVFANRVSKTSTPLNSSGDIALDRYILRFGNDEKEILSAIEKAAPLYERRGLGVLFKDGKLRTELLGTSRNVTQNAANVDWLRRLTPTQAGDIARTAESLGISTKDVQDVLSGKIRPLDNLNYSRFVASLQEAEGRLVFDSQNPYQAFKSQGIDLFKKYHNEPLINQIYDNIKDLETKLSTIEKRPFGSGSVWDIPKRIDAEITLMNDYANVLRNTPTLFDQAVAEALAVLPEASVGTVKNILRKSGDTYTFLESTMKLGGNISGSLLNVIEALRSTGSEVDPVTFARMMGKISKNPLKYMDDIKQVIKSNPAYSDALFQGEIDFFTTSSFGNSQKLFGSRTAAAGHKLFMSPFTSSIHFSKLLSFSILDEVSTTMGLKGAKKTQWILDTLQSSKALPDFDLIPLMRRSPGMLKPALLFKSFIVRMADTEVENFMRSAKNLKLGQFSKRDASNILGFSVLPALLFGAQTSPTLNLINQFVASTTGGIGESSNGEHKPLDFMEMARAFSPRGTWDAGGIASRGLIGQFSNLDTSRFSADLAAYFDGGYLPTDTGDELAKSMFGVWQAAMDYAQTQRPDLFVGGVGESVGNFLTNTTTVGNRGKKAADILTKGGIFDSKGRLVRKIDEEDKVSAAVSTFAGITPADIKESRSRVRQIDQDAALLDSRARNLVMRAMKADARGDKREFNRLALELKVKYDVSISDRFKQEIIDRSLNEETRQLKRLGTRKRSLLFRSDE